MTLTRSTTSPLATYTAHCERGELAYQVCTDDGHAVFFPRVIAPGSGSPNLEWRTSKGLGTVYATTVVFNRDAPPHNVALIDIDEGFRMMSRVEHIDGVFGAASQVRMTTLALSEYLGIIPRYQDSTIIGGSSFMSHVGHAMAAIEHGLCEVALIAHGSTQRSVSRATASPREFNPYETPYEPFLPASAYALAASRHMHEFGTTREQLAEVAVAARQWALLNPVAWEKTPLTVREVLDARMVSYPFTINTILFLEDLGLCPKGEGGPFVAEGHIAPGGSLPVNTADGGLSYCHPGMYGLLLLIEAVRQLRGDGGKRQVANCEIAVAHGNGGMLSSQATVVLGNAGAV